MLKYLTIKYLDLIVSFLNLNASKIIAFIITFFFLTFLCVRIAGIYAIGTDTWGVMENSVIYSIQRMLAGHPLYENPEMPPFSITQYSPIYYYIVFGICKLSDTNAEELLTIYKVSRTLSLIFNLVFAGLTGKIARHFYGVKKNESLLISMIAFVIIQRHGYSRPDSLSNITMLLSVISYLWYLKSVDKKLNTFIPLIITGFCVMLSIYSKQSGIILLVFLLFYQLIIINKLKDALYLVISFLIIFFLFLLLFASSDLYLFYQNVVQGLNNGVDLVWFWYFIIIDFFCSVNGLIFTILILFTSSILIRERETKLNFLGWLLIALFSFATITGLKTGSNTNYYLEASVLSLVGYATIMSRIQVPPVIKILVILLGLLHFLMNPKILVPINNVEKFSKSIYTKEKEVLDYIEKYHFLQKDEWIFVNTNGFESFLNGIFYEKGLFPHKDIISQKQTFDYRSFDSLYLNGKIKLIISQSDTTSYLGNNFINYKLIKQINKYKIYERP